ncbi:MAG: CRTAC1 family protein [Pseudomonadota bacterium]
MLSCVRTVALCAVMLAFGACSDNTDPASETDTWFRDVTRESGARFEHENGMRDELWFAEMMGGGLASVDIDNDGDQDLVFAQGQALDGPDEQGVLHAVLRNDLAAGVLRFTDITADAGLLATGYAMGLAAGDVNNDGRVDLYVTAFGPDALYMNLGDGRFERTPAGPNDARWSVSAAFTDIDRDGRLDLYVGNYVDYRLANHKPCRSTTSARDYCSPTVYPPQGDALWRNVRGDPPVWEDVSAKSGIGKPAGGALGVIAADLDGDGHTDVYVANDGTPNLLWRNDGQGHFEDVAALSGAAVNMGGAPEASMGLDAADHDDDGDVDLFMTHLDRESNTLYLNDGSGFFDDRSATTGLASSSLPFTGFGTRWADFDGDGDLDLFSANGAVTQVQARIDAGDAFPLGQRNQLFEQRDGVYVDASAAAGVDTGLDVSRGMALTDLNNDGGLDIVVGNNRGVGQVLLNARPPARWIGLDVRQREGGRVAIGADVRLMTDGGQRVRRVHRDGSYASSSDPRVVFAAVPERVRIVVRWPDGHKRTYTDLALNRYHTLSP